MNYLFFNYLTKPGNLYLRLSQKFCPRKISGQAGKAIRNRKFKINTSRLPGCNPFHCLKDSISQTAFLIKKYIFLSYKITSTISPIFIMPSFALITFCPKLILLFMLRYVANVFNGSFPLSAVSWLVQVIIHRLHSFTP